MSKEHFITGVILAGGKSSRMKSDKGLLKYNGKQLVEHSIEVLHAFCPEILISTNQKKYHKFGFPLIPDHIKNIGPIGGFHAAFMHTSNDLLVTACDTPGINSRLFEDLLANAMKYDLVYCRLPNREILPLPILLKRRLLTKVEHQIEQKNYKLQQLIMSCLEDKSIKCKAIAVQEAPLNINSRSDLENIFT